LIHLLYVDIFGDYIGGGQISLLALLKRLDRRLYYPLVVCPSRGKFARVLRNNGIEVKIIEMKALKTINFLQIIKTIKDFILLLKEKKIDLVHANGLRAAIYSGLAARWQGVPFIWHVRVIEFGGWPEKLCAYLAERIIVNSEAVGEKFNWLKNKSKKVVCIYNGVDLDEFHPGIKGDNIRKEFNLGNSPLVGIVGGLIPWKGHRYFLEAAATVSRKFSEVKFLVVGEDFVGGRYRRQLEDLAFKLGLVDRIVFAGFRQDIPEILGSLEILVLTSLQEPFGRVLIEAMACAKPVVATNAGGVPEIVHDGETGLLVPMRDPEALARSIKLLLNNKEKAKEMGEKGRRRVEENFTIEAHVKKVESLYQALR